MSANEKHAATYHGGQYTPATENVEHSYVAYRSSKVDLISGHHEFTRWLETVHAEAKAEAWDECVDYAPHTTHERKRLKADNPYKETP